MHSTTIFEHNNLEFCLLICRAQYNPKGKHMLHYAFCRRSVLAHTRRVDIFQFNLWTTPQQREIRIDLALDVLNAPEYTPQAFRKEQLGKGTVYIPTRYEDKVFLRHLNSQVRRHYGINITSRDQIIHQLQTLRKSDVQISFLRTDIRQFFRNAPLVQVIERLRAQKLLSRVQLIALNFLQEQSQHDNAGLLWGLPLSSTLAEVCMLGFDQACRRIAGVYYFQRYVDDIVIVSGTAPNEIEEAVRFELAQVSPALKINKRKTEPKRELDYPPDTPTEINILGYRLIRSKAGKSVSVETYLSQRRLAKIKKRVSASANRFLKDGVWHDFTQRIKLLTGNYEIYRSEHSTGIKTGVYYSHRSLQPLTQLDELDQHLRNEITRVRTTLRRRGAQNYRANLNRLFRCSFKVGFERRICHRISPTRLEHLISLWKYVR